MSRRVLVIDDADEFRDLLRLTLKFSGYDVTPAAHGLAGLEACRAGSFDLIITDFDMPVMNGLDFIRHYRAEFGTATPILLLTAEQSEAIERALATGASGYLAKPFSPVQLTTIVKQHLGSS